MEQRIYGIQPKPMVLLKVTSTHVDTEWDLSVCKCKKTTSNYDTDVFTPLIGGGNYRVKIHFKRVKDIRRKIKPILRFV
jgi:hypothetical protein